MANSNKSKKETNNKSSINKVDEMEKDTENIKAKKENTKKSSNEAKKNSKVKKSKEKSSFGKGFKAELKKVSWPTGKQVVNNTIAVIFIVLVVTAVVFCLDLAFGAMNKYGIEGVKALVQTQDNNSEEVVTNVEDTENAEAEGSEEKSSEESSEDKATEETKAEDNKE